MKEELKTLFGESILFDEPLAPHTSIRIGGPADAFFTPRDKEELKKIIQQAMRQQIPYFVFGAGSNLLVRDGGIRGIVISLQNFNRIERLEETMVRAEAGVFVPKLVEWTAEQKLTGIESLIGVPGTVGGAVTMNAGTREGTIGPLVEEVEGLTKEGDEVSLSGDKLEFKYRSSKIPRGMILTAVTLKLKEGSAEKIQEKIRSFKEHRLKSQPLNYPNLGSVFKNPIKGGFAGQMIEEAGLKEIRVGKARISAKHANFIINEGGATAKDVQILIGLARDKVKEKFQILLEPEVKIVGEDLK